MIFGVLALWFQSFDVKIGSFHLKKNKKIGSFQLMVNQLIALIVNFRQLCNIMKNVEIGMRNRR